MTETTTEKLAYIKGKLVDIESLEAIIDALPDAQKGCLRALAEHGRYSRIRRSFLWTNQSTTERMCAALAKKDLAQVEMVAFNEAADAPEKEKIYAWYTPHPLVVEVFAKKAKALDAIHEAHRAERVAKQAQEDLARDTQNRAIKALVAAHSEQYANLLRNIEAELREERGL